MTHKQIPTINSGQKGLYKQFKNDWGSFSGLSKDCIASGKTITTQIKAAEKSFEKLKQYNARLFEVQTKLAKKGININLED